jgi:hypothetical protein
MIEQGLLDDYWEHWRLLRGNRDDRLQAKASGRSHDVVDEAVEEGNPAAIELLLALAEAAPSEGDCALIGAGPLEKLISIHSARLTTPEGASLVDAIDAAARHSGRFRRALRGVVMGAEVPDAVKNRLRDSAEGPRNWGPPSGRTLPDLS